MPLKGTVLQIANPIYDVVFKYMMEDAQVCRLFLSAITDKNVVEVSFLPQELSGDKESNTEKPSLGLSVYRLDFSAKVKDDTGKETVIIIEVQKARLFHDMMRFRRYLGKQYINENYKIDGIDATGKKTRNGIPIYSVYFFGESFLGLDQHPIVHIRLQTLDHTTKNNVAVDREMVQSLFHEGTIVTIPALKQRRRDDLERLLSIFDQENRTKDMHIMNVKESDFPPQFQPIIRRLQKAVAVKEVRDVMDIEDDFVREIREYEEMAAESKEMLHAAHEKLALANLIEAKALLKQEEAQRKQEEAQRKQEEAQRKQEEAQRKQEEEKKLKEEALRKQEEERKQKNEAILLMLKSGIDKHIVAKQLNLSLEYLDGLMSK